MGRDAVDRGRAVERYVEAYLVRRGYEILARNFQSRFGEIDLVAEDGGVLAFIEVKYRGPQAYGSALESVSRRKRMRLVRTGRYYLAKTGTAKACRFDIVTVDNDSGRYLLRLYKNAFNLNDL